MFTGIVTSVGEIVNVEQRGDLRLAVRSDLELSSVALGASISCSGACLTVVDKGTNWFAVDVSSESIARTATGLWQAGAKLNLERALRMGDELGGHLVTGHVDAVGTIAELSEEGGSLRVAVDVPRHLGPMIASKGSITLDGVSLTVNLVEDRPDATRFTVNLIPHTAQHTTLGQLSVGSEVNIEIDILARYLRRMTTAM